MQRKCHSCSTLFDAHGNDVLCDACKNPATRKSFKPPEDTLTWQQKFDMKWQQYDDAHEYDGVNGKRGSKATHCCVCSGRLPPIQERKYGRFCSSKCKRSYNERKDCS